jgi:hypothetical protein
MRLPFLALLVGAVIPPPALPAQTRTAEPRPTVRETAVLRAAPGGRRLFAVRGGAAVRVSDARRDWLQVTVEGWMPRSLLGGRAGDFPVSVRGGRAATLRASANARAAVVATLGGGTGLQRVETRGSWVRVRRTGWMSADLVRGVGPAAAGEVARAARQGAAKPAAKPPTKPAAAPPTKTAVAPKSGAAPAPGRPAPASTTARVDSSAAKADSTPLRTIAAAESRRRTAAAVPLRATPGGGELTTLAAGMETSEVGRSGEWVKVRLEGWVRADQLEPASDRAQLAAADLRANPAAAAGKRVEWEVELLALQRGDTLRRALMPGEPYFLARGPAGENVLLYLTIPRELVQAARTMPLPGKARIVARVRSGRSEPAGVPVLDLEAVTRR